MRQHHIRRGVESATVLVDVRDDSLARIGCGQNEMTRTDVEQEQRISVFTDQ
jgi:hypothetical protein